MMKVGRENEELACTPGVHVEGGGDVYRVRDLVPKRGTFKRRGWGKIFDV
jgi:hypothetical protein